MGGYHHLLLLLLSWVVLQQRLSPTCARVPCLHGHSLSKKCGYPAASCACGHVERSTGSNACANGGQTIHNGRSASLKAAVWAQPQQGLRSDGGLVCSSVGATHCMAMHGLQEGKLRTPASSSKSSIQDTVRPWANYHHLLLLLLLSTEYCSSGRPYLCATFLACTGIHSLKCGCPSQAAPAGTLSARQDQCLHSEFRQIHNGRSTSLRGCRMGTTAAKELRNDSGLVCSSVEHSCTRDTWSTSKLR
jgi:hypothetical protein